MELRVERKVCKKCNRSFPITKFKKVYSKNKITGEKITYRARSCNECYRKAQNIITHRKRVKSVVAKETQDINYRAMMRMLKENHELAARVVASNPVRYRMLLWEEREASLDKIFKRSMRYSKATIDKVALSRSLEDAFERIRYNWRRQEELRRVS